MTNLMLLLMLIGGVADITSTEYMLAQGGYEVNPLMANRAVRVGLNIAVPVAAFFLLRSDKPTLNGKIVCYIHVGSKVMVTGRNVYIGMSVRW